MLVIHMVITQEPSIQKFSCHLDMFQRERTLQDDEEKMYQVTKMAYKHNQEILFYMNATRKSYKLQERRFLSKTKRINARLHEDMQHV